MKSWEQLFAKRGKYITDPKYKEILVLDKLLNDANIPHTMDKFFDGWQIIYPENGTNKIMDAIEHFGSYGHEQDLLEIMGLITIEDNTADSVKGWLTAQNVFERIKRHWETLKEGTQNATD